MSGFGKLTFTELKIFLREPQATLLTIALPVAITAMFGFIAQPKTTDDPIKYYFPTMSLSVGLAILAFNMLPTILAAYREKGILRRLVTTPISPSLLLGAQVAVSIITAVVSTVLVVVVGNLAFGFDLPKQFGGFVVVVALGMLALFAVGVSVAAVVPTSRAATAVGVLIFFVSLFLGGVFIPKELMPSVMSRIGDYTPLGALVQAMRDTWSGSWPQPTHLGVLAGCIALFGLLAARLFRWE